jgi:hypothetical protein
MGQATAQLNLAELSKTLGYPEEGPPPPPATASQNEGRNTSGSAHNNQGRRKSMEQMDLLKMTPDATKAKATRTDASDNLNKSGLLDEEDFFDFISRFQSKRMDDQRCSLAVPPLSKPSMSNQSTQNSSSNQGSKPAQSHPFSSHTEYGNKKATIGQTQSTNPVSGASMQNNSSGATPSGPFKQQKDELLGKYLFMQGTGLIERKCFF